MLFVFQWTKCVVAWILYALALLPRCHVTHQYIVVTRTDVSPANTRLHEEMVTIHSHQNN